MQDRVPTYPGRVKLTPVPGQDGFYDLERADDPVVAGTPINKATLLTDETAAAYGLDDNATPEGVFDFLSFLPPYTEYWWKRSAITIAQRTNSIPLKIGSNNARTYQYADSVSIVNGEIMLNNPQSITVNSNVSTAASQLVSLAPCYMKNAAAAYTKFFYLPSGSVYDSAAYGTIQYRSDENSLYLGWELAGRPKANRLYIEAEPDSEEYVHNPDRSAFPDYGINGNYWYEYVDSPFIDFKTKVRIENGTYVGTGQTGADHTNVLEFSFTPKLVMIIGDDHVCFFIYGCAKGIGNAAIIGGTNVVQTVAWESTKMTWFISYVTNGTSAYVPDEKDQLNRAGYTYHYIAIG